MKSLPDQDLIQASLQTYRTLQLGVRKFWLRTQQLDRDHRLPIGITLSRGLFQPAKWGFIPVEDRKGLRLARLVGLQDSDLLEQVWGMEREEEAPNDVMIEAARMGSKEILTLMLARTKQIADLQDVPMADLVHNLREIIRWEPRKIPHGDMVWLLFRFLF